VPCIFTHHSFVFLFWLIVVYLSSPKCILKPKIPPTGRAHEAQYAQKEAKPGYRERACLLGGEGVQSG